MTEESLRRAKEYAKRGSDSFRRGNYSAAIEWLTRAIAEDPDDTSSILRRGAARGAMSDIRGATSDIQGAKQRLTGDGESKRRRWASAQLGEAIRSSVRDGVLAPSASGAEVEALFSTLDASIEAFSDALREDPEDAWTYAHRGAAETLAYSVGARFGLPPARVRGYAEAAWSDLDAAVHRNPSYTWAMTYKGILLASLGANANDDEKRRERFTETVAVMEEAGRADKRYPVLHMLAELALQMGQNERVIELGWGHLEIDPDDVDVRYCMAAALTWTAEVSGAGDAALANERRASAASFVERARQAMLARRSRLSAMLGGLALLEGRYEVALSMLGDILEYPDIETLSFMRSDPMWAPARGPEGDQGSDARLGAVRDAYKKLFPAAAYEENAP